MNILNNLHLNSPLDYALWLKYSYELYLIKFSYNFLNFRGSKLKILKLYGNSLFPLKTETVFFFCVAGDKR
jgi:hypothetical protein